MGSVHPPVPNFVGHNPCCVNANKRASERACHIRRLQDAGSHLGKKDAKDTKLDTGMG